MAITRVSLPLNGEHSERDVLKLSAETLKNMYTVFKGQSTSGVDRAILPTPGMKAFDTDVTELTYDTRYCEGSADPYTIAVDTPALSASDESAFKALYDDDGTMWVVGNLFDDITGSEFGMLQFETTSSGEPDNTGDTNQYSNNDDGGGSAFHLTEFTASDFVRVVSYGNDLWMNKFDPDNSNLAEAMVIDKSLGAVADKMHVYNATRTTDIDADFDGAKDIVIWDGYAVIIQPASNTLQHSDLQDIQAWTSTNVLTVQWTNESIQRLAVFKDNLWVFADDKIRMYYNSGNPTGVFFSERQGVGFEVGINALQSLAQSETALFFLDSSNRVVMAEDFGNLREITSPAIREKIGNFTTVSDARGFYYQYAGQEFYHIDFPTEGETYVYSLTTDTWHRRTSTVNSVEVGHIMTAAVKHKGKYIFASKHDSSLDSGGANSWTHSLYSFDDTAYTELGTAIERERVTTHFTNDGDHIRIGKLLMDVETTAGTGTMTMEYSKDGGNSWSSTTSQTIPDSSSNDDLMQWNRLGRSRKFTLRFKTSDAIQFNIVNIWAEVNT